MCTAGVRSLTERILLLVAFVAEHAPLCQGLLMDMRLAYVGCKLDRAAHLRANEDSLCERLRQPSTRILPVWRDRNLVTSDNPPRVRALSGRLGEAAISLAREIVFLGLEENGPAWFACDLSHHEEGRLASLADGGFEDLGAGGHPDVGR